MFEYSIDTWLLIFFTYCFLGWIWETCFVSIKDRKFTNRGFMYGPFLPIYGFGAITMLYATFPVRDSLVGIYFLGTISVTILELLTGILMEKLFKMRYWDYSYKKYHYNGYICLSSTIAWGFFAILLIKYVNAPIETFLLSLSDETKSYISTFMLIYFTADVTISAKNALDLKKLLEMAYNNIEIVRDVADQIEQVQENFNEGTTEIKEQMLGIRERIRAYRDENVIRVIETGSYFKLNINEKIEGVSLKIAEDLKSNKVELTENEFEQRQHFLSKLIELKANIANKESRLKQIDLGNFKGAMGILKRNPNANSNKLKETIEQLKKM